MATTQMTGVDSARRRATARRILGAGAVALMVSTLLSGTASAETFSNPTPIVVPLPGAPTGCPPACPSEQATPYPSNIPVSGLTGTVTDVNVTLHDLTYELKPADLDIMVVAPDGTAVMLMSDACGDNTNENPITAAIDLTFDDEASDPLPADSPCSGGTFRPIDDDNDTGEFPFHGHADDFFPGAPVQPSATTLSTFDGAEPNGTWSLYVVDDYPNDPDPAGSAGQIAGGWSLDIITTTSPTTTSTTVASTTSTTAGGTTTTTQGTGTTTTTLTGGTTTTTLDGGGGGGGGTTTTTSAGGTTTTSVAGPTLTLSKSTVAPGDTVVATGNGLPASTPLQLNFLSHPVGLSAVTTNAAGSFQTTVTIPTDATAGAHQINVTDSAGKVLAAANLTVVRTITATLARTGYGVQAMIVLATGLILLGYLFFTSASAPAFTSRRRRHRW